VDLRGQLTLIRTWFGFVVASALLAGGVAFVVSGQLPKTYEARAIILVGQSLSTVNPDYTQLLASQRLSTTYAKVATTRPILREVIAELGLTETPEQLADHIRADADPDSTLLTITTKDSSAERAADIANALADQLTASSPTLQGFQADMQKSIEDDLKATRDLITATQSEVESLVALENRTPAQDSQLTTLQTRLIALRSTFSTLLSLSSTSTSGELSVIEPAVADPTPISPQPFLNALVGVLVGLLIAGGVAAARTYLDDTLKTAEDVQEVAGLASLGAVSRIRGGETRTEIYQLVALLYPRSATTEAYRTLRTNVEFASLDSSIRSLLVTSAVPGEGKTVTASNLAIVFAQSGKRVLLLDADLRKPGVSRIFNLPNDRGLTNLLRGDSADPMDVIQKTEEERLHVLTTGHQVANPVEVLGSQRMRSIIETLRSRYDLLIVDSAPVQVVADAIILSSYMDGTLLVIDAARTRRAAVRQAREALAKADAKVIGAVLNRIPEGASAENLYYGDYYGATPKTGSSGATDSAHRESAS